MPVSAAYLAYVVDQLANFSPVRSRRMFGGVGLYADELFFALIAEDSLYFKVDDSNRADYQARGCRQFQPFADDPTFSMGYYAVPEEVIEDGDELKAWARKACAVALAKAALKRPKAPAAARPAAKKKQASTKQSTRGPPGPRSKQSHRSK